MCEELSICCGGIEKNGERGGGKRCKERERVGERAIEREMGGERNR